MAGYLLLEGGAEFGGQMAEPDLRAMELAGGPDALICIIPTAAAPDNNAQRAGNNGVRWFRSLGAKQVELLPRVDKASANDPHIADRISQSRLIYMLGGFTGYLGETLKGSASWQAMLRAYEAGAVIAGSSAGAMVMCHYYFDPARGQVVEGLELLPNACVLPHHNTFGKAWAPRLSKLLPDVVLLGIDERTGMLDDGDEGRKVGWRVYGQGTVTLYRRGQSTVYRAGESF
ncbi:MAG TPA: Type 1 glutamine amidotransferase-like domain-containing protein [Ktedonobacteraceae bacterium]|nr:Type 1 glutamine amidotransferase-like domain-containing protein [Ktedonobacteraceae bacterium]